MEARWAAAAGAVGATVAGGLCLWALRTDGPRPAPSPLRAEDLPTDPYDLLAEWVDAASARSGYAEGHAMTLATASSFDGPTARTVICQAMGESVGGLVVGTNRSSQKCRQLLEQPRVECVFRWGDQQVRVRGEARLGSARESDAAFARLQRGQQLGLSLLRQGQPADEVRHAALTSAWSALAAKDDNAPVPRPEHFTAVCIRPVSFEFYQGGSASYINDRWLFCRTPDGSGFRLVGRLEA